MPRSLKGSCRCGAIRFEVASHSPVPYQLCYCSICRTQQGGGGYAVNLGAQAETRRIEGEEHLGLFRATIQDEEHPGCELSTAERRFCRECGSALWLYDPEWPELVLSPARSTATFPLSLPWSTSCSNTGLRG